jgi:uncharacterized protein
VNLHTIFLAQGRLRAIWRFLIAVAAVITLFIAIQLLLQVFFTLVAIKPSFVLVNGVVSILTLPALLGIFKLMTHHLDFRPAGTAGMALCGRWRTELLQGLAVGTVMMLAVAGAEWAFGAAQFTWSGQSATNLLLWGGTGFIVMAFAATNEELIFRGYPFQRLVESVGAPGAILILSGLFGAVHLGNPNASWVGAANTVLVGVLFSIAYLRTRMLWLPIGMHFAWNYVQGFVLGLPISGMSLPVSMLHAEAKGSQILTGGAYGPEAGLLTTGVILVATGYLALSKSIYVSEETQALLRQPPIDPKPPFAGLKLDSTKPAGRESVQ